MQTFVNLFGPLDALHGFIRPILVVLVLVNVGTRILSHRRHVEQYEEGGAEAISRFLPHEVSNLVLVLASFYFLTVHQDGGLILSVLVVGMVVTDFFEFESRKVEARRELELDKPKAAIFAWVLAGLYVGYELVFTGPIGQLL